MAAEASLAASTEPSGNKSISSREYRPVPQPRSRPTSGPSCSSSRILRTGASSVVRSES